MTVWIYTTVYHFVISFVNILDLFALGQKSIREVLGNMYALILGGFSGFRHVFVVVHPR